MQRLSCWQQAMRACNSSLSLVVFAATIVRKLLLIRNFRAGSFFSGSITAICSGIESKEKIRITSENSGIIANAFFSERIGCNTVLLP